MLELHLVKVRRKGQVTIPAHIRKKMKIGEGALLEVEERPEGILLKPLPAIKTGKVVGRKEYRRIIKELDQFRGKQGTDIEKLFGALRGKGPAGMTTQQIKDELRAGWHDEYDENH